MRSVRDSHSTRSTFLREWRTRRKSRATLAVLGVAASLVLAACGGNNTASGNGGGKVVSGATVTFAEAPGSTPVYIFPLYSLAYYSTNNTAQLENLLFAPLYWFGKGNSLDINPALSLANPPVYSDNNRTVTITLKSGIKWSDGQPITSRDVEFWINLLKAEKGNYGPYVPGAFPDNVTSADYPNAATVVLHLNASYNPTWFTGTALSEITPIPQHAWDKTSMTGKAGNYDTTTAGAQAVYNFLNAQGKDTATFSTSPLWKVIDGPMRLLANTPDGRFTFAPNPAYFGPKSKIGKLVELPFTSNAAENDALLTGGVDYGYIAGTQAPEVPRLQRQGYQVDPWPFYGINYLYVNYTDPAAPFMKQQYVRVAMQELINQPLLIKGIYHGYAYPTNGPVPDKPLTSLVSSSESKPLYPYSPSKAIALLKSHGWNVVPNGTSTCADPSKCGAGITKGMPLELTAIQPTGYDDIDAMMQAIQSSMSLAGIKWNLVGLTNNGIGELLGPCKAGSPCKWTLIDYEEGYYWAPGSFPDGGPAFGTGGAQVGGAGPYAPHLDALIQAVRTASASQSTTAMDNYQQYVEQELPGLWIPNLYFQVSVIKNTLHGVLPQNPIGGNFTPQPWYMTSG
jgi:peptide/nickel transport system substrate-binding protein